MTGWDARQFRREFDDFSADCTEDAWNDLLLNYAILREKGPFGAGASVAKKLSNGGGIWELIGQADNCQPRVLFYVKGQRIVFVVAFVKKGNAEYKRKIKLAQSRRKLIEEGARTANEVQTLKRTDIH